MVNATSGIGGGGGAQKTQGAGQQDGVKKVADFAQQNKIDPKDLIITGHQLMQQAPQNTIGVA